MAVEDLSTLEHQLTEERRKVDVANHNFSARELVRMMSDGELNVSPTYQRKFRWTTDNESLFIESLFLGLPIPPVFVATNVGFQWEIVDGLQRLSTIAHFMAPDEDDLSRIGKKTCLQLAGLEKLTQLNGMTFDDLPKNLQIYIGRQPLQVVSLTDKSVLQIRFDVFERLNKGGVALTPQEVRACVYQGDFHSFVEELSENADFNGLLKLQEKNQSDGTSAEQVLKFFAYKNDRESFDGRVEVFLNNYMDKAAKKFSKHRERALFEKSAKVLHEICGGPFLTPKHFVTPLVQFEACLVAVAELIDESKLGTPPDGWQLDNELRQSSTGGTNTKAMLRRRIDRAKELFSGNS